jgi:hypothetical protein
MVGTGEDAGGGDGDEDLNGTNGSRRSDADLGGPPTT